MNLDKLYISTTASDAYDAAQKYGLGIEIADFCTALNIDDNFAETDKHLKNKLDGIERRLFHAPFNELFPCAIDKKARELAFFRYKQAVTLTEKYGASKVIIHGGYNPYMYYPEWYVEQSVLFWRDFMDTLSENVHIVLENVSEETPQLLLDIVKGVKDSRMKICLDIGHINVYSKISVTEWIEQCKGFVGHFHIHNNDGTYDSHNAPENGSILMKEVLPLAEKLCPDATYTLETMSAEASVHRIMQLNKYLQQ